MGSHASPMATSPSSVRASPVTGVHGVCADGTECTVNAKTAVVLVTGGLSGNTEMLVEHDDGWGFTADDIIPTTNNYGHTGDGVKMAMEIGAAFADSDPNYMVFPMSNAVDWPKAPREGRESQ